MADEKENVPAPKQVRLQPIDYYYFNGFELSMSFSDMGMLLMCDVQPQSKLGMSFTTAKTLAENLSKMVQDFEAATEHNVMNMNDVRISFEKVQNSS